MGGSEKAEALMDEYRSYVQSYSSELLRGFKRVEARMIEASSE